MLGSTASVATPNIVLNTAVAETLKQCADRLEGATDFKAALHELIRDMIRKHKRIIFNGNGYDDAWIKEATEKRGLLNLKSTPECLPYFSKDKNIRLFTSHKVFSECEIHSRLEILLENYCKVLHIEALTMLEMAERDILPAVSAFAKALSEGALAKKGLLADIDCTYEETTVKKISSLSSCMHDRIAALEGALLGAKNIEDIAEQAMYYKDTVFAAMNELRAAGDELEVTVARSTGLTQPTEICFSVYAEAAATFGNQPDVAETGRPHAGRRKSPGSRGSPLLLPFVRQGKVCQKCIVKIYDRRENKNQITESYHRLGTVGSGRFEAETVGEVGENVFHHGRIRQGGILCRIQKGV